MNPSSPAHLFDFLDRGYVYKGLKPVNWCIRDRTALAEAEVEYENTPAPPSGSVFALTSDPALIDANLAGRKVYGTIWTTTRGPSRPTWHRLPPNFEYVAAEVNDEVYIVANGTAQAIQVRTRECKQFSTFFKAYFAHSLPWLSGNPTSYHLPQTTDSPILKSKKTRSRQRHPSGATAL